MAFDTTSGSEAPRVYGWIEFPVWATQIHQLSELIERTSKQAKECEYYGNIIRLADMVPNSRFSDLECKFQGCLVPFDCGGEDPIDHTPWNGWWRTGYRYLVIYEVSSLGEQFVSINDLRDLLCKHKDSRLLYLTLTELIDKSDKSPPTALTEIAAIRPILHKASSAVSLRVENQRSAHRSFSTKDLRGKITYFRALLSKLAHNQGERS